jgi:hypothetical protein
MFISGNLRGAVGQIVVALRTCLNRENGEARAKKEKEAQSFCPSHRDSLMRSLD